MKRKAHFPQPAVFFGHQDPNQPNLRILSNTPMCIVPILQWAVSGLIGVPLFKQSISKVNIFNDITAAASFQFIYSLLF